MGRALLYALISGRNFSKKQKSRNARSPAKLSERLAQSLAEVVCVQVGNYRRTMIISNSVYLTVNQTIPRSVYISSLGVGADFVVSPTLNFDRRSPVLLKYFVLKWNFSLGDMSYNQNRPYRGGRRRNRGTNVRDSV